MKFINFLLICAIFLTTMPFAFAQTKTKFEVKSLVPDGKKTKEESSVIIFDTNSFKVTKEKSELVTKEFNYTDIKVVDYSYSKKPIFSTGAAVATAILLSPVFLVTLFIKKKQHWMTIRTESDYAVLKLDKDNFRQIMNEFEIKKIKVTTLNEDEDSDKKKDK